MSFNFSNAPASLQVYIHTICTEELDIFVMIYLDNILIYTQDSGQLDIDAVCWL